MYHCLDSALCKMSLQSISPFAEDRKLMIDITLVRDTGRKRDEGIDDMVVVIMGNDLTMRIVSVKVF